ncbi:MAG: hypothetical protein QM535_17735 [Limnohabitans sp.]|nr:hypothetical protein [Limnohabitans sp.]
MGKIKYLLPLYFFTISCNNHKQNTKLDKFTFDTAEHYSTEKKDSIITAINKKKYKNLTDFETLYLDFVFGNIQTKVTDTSIVTILEKIKFKKRVFDNSKRDELRKIFSEEFCEEEQLNACSPIYRDIYIFKKNKQITGIAKVCFDCGIITFTSKYYNWARYGECDRSIKLKNL